MPGVRAMGNHDSLLWLGNGGAAVTVLGTIFGLLPPLAAIAAICWYLIQMYESKTYRDWRDARLRRKKERKIARLQARQKVIEAELEALSVKQAAAAFAAHMVATAETVAATKVADAKVTAVEEAKKSDKSGVNRNSD